jgi:hypothetical protein
MSALQQDPDFFAYTPPLVEKMKIFAGLTSGNDDNEWYTPSHIIEMARKVLGAIDMDPASSATANETVKAKTFYDRHANGLDHPWRGRIWLNPPYSKDLMARFAGKLVHQFELGNVDSAILLTHDCCDTKWWQHCAAAASYACFPLGRLAFFNPTRPDKSSGAGRGQCLMYFGTDGDRFRQVFGAIGTVAALRS